MKHDGQGVNSVFLKEELRRRGHDGIAAHTVRPNPLISGAFEENSCSN